jgi:hypothetical protein
MEMDWNTFFVVVGPIVGLIGTIVTVVVSNGHNRKLLEVKLNEIRNEQEERRREQELSVARLVVPKCLDTVQAAFKLSMEINELLWRGGDIAAGTIKLETKGPKSFDECHLEVQRIRDWYDNNCVYLPNTVRNHFLRTIHDSHRHLDDIEYNRKEYRRTRDAWDSLHDLTQGLVADITGFMDRYGIFDKLAKEKRP